MSLYPIHINLSGKRCVVVGAGPVAERKARALLSQGGLVRLVAPEATPKLKEMAAEGVLLWMRAMYRTVHLENAFLVFAATDLRDVNAAVARDAQERNILVCCADDPDEGNFVSPSSVQRGPLVFTVSTSGQSPTLAAVLRAKLESEYGPEWAELTRIMGRLREQVQSQGNEAARKAAVERVIADEELLGLLRREMPLEAEARAVECL